MWRSQPTRNSNAGQRAVRLGLYAIMAVVPCMAQSAAIGELLARVEYGRPVLSWSNRLGEVYVIEATTNLAAPAWHRRATLTTEAS